jgi:ribosome recycling factor
MRVRAPGGSVRALRAPASPANPLLYSAADCKGFTGERAMLDNIKKDAQTRMQKSVDSLKHDLTRLRTGRASTSLVEPLKVSYYGADTPISQVANIALADARSITITPFEKSLVGPIEKAILASDLGLTPNTMGNVIRINLPVLTEERRRELSKHVAHEGENAKVAVRNVRRDALHQAKELLKDKKITEDEERRAEEDIQKYTDKYVKDIDGVVKAKEDELMSM